MKLILASSSIHRKKILEYLGLPFEILVPDIDEEAIKADSPYKLVQNIAFGKANKIYKSLKNDQAIILAADSLALNQTGVVLGKPKDKQNAREILGSIIGTWHSLLTGYAIIRTNPYQEIIQTAETKVLMREVSDDQFEEYIQSEAWKDLAGGYGIQQEASSFIKKIDGCFLNVVGFPLQEICTHLNSLGLSIEMMKIKKACETINSIHCCIPN